MAATAPPLTPAVGRSITARRALMAFFVSVDGGYLGILPGMLAMGTGMGLAMTPSTEAITGSLPREKQGVASALNDVTREFRTALGVALLGAGSHADDLDRAAQQSFVDGWHQAMWAGVVVMGVLFAYVALGGPGKAPVARTDRTPTDEAAPVG